MHWSVPADAAPTTFLPLDHALCGVYTLHFANGERYVGQTVNLTNRLADHLCRWRDIEGLDFIAASHEELNDLERRMIAQTEREYTVRNRALTGMPGGEVPLDLVVDSQLQKEWFDGVLATYPEDTRMKEAERRIRTQPKFDQLQRYREFDAVLGDLTTYIANVIPWPSVTGGLFWGVSAVPGTAHVKGRRRLFTVNAHNVELLYTHGRLLPGDPERRRAQGSSGEPLTSTSGTNHGAGPHAPGPVELREVSLRCTARSRVGGDGKTSAGHFLTPM
jgi:hypothetical protein